MLKLIEWYEDGFGMNEEVLGVFNSEEELKEYLKEEGLELYSDYEEGLGVREDDCEGLWYEF